MSKENEMIAISKERYENLLRIEKRFEALDIAGVDNWSGYEYAMEILNTLE